MNKEYIFPKKSNFKVIDISEVDIDLPDLKNIFESKSVVIAKWLMQYIEQALKNRKIEVDYLMPTS